MENVLSTVAEEGCTSATLAAAADQFGKAIVCLPKLKGGADIPTSGNVRW